MAAPQELCVDDEVEHLVFLLVASYEQVNELTESLQQTLREKNAFQAEAKAAAASLAALALGSRQTAGLDGVFHWSQEPRGNTSATPSIVTEPSDNSWYLDSAPYSRESANLACDSPPAALLAARGSPPTAQSSNSSKNFFDALFDQTAPQAQEIAYPVRTPSRMTSAVVLPRCLPVVTKEPDPSAVAAVRQRQLPGSPDSDLGSGSAGTTTSDSDSDIGSGGGDGGNSAQLARRVAELEALVVHSSVEAATAQQDFYEAKLENRQLQRRLTLLTDQLELAGYGEDGATTFLSGELRHLKETRIAEVVTLSNDVEEIKRSYRLDVERLSSEVTALLAALAREKQLSRQQQPASDTSRSSIDGGAARKGPAPAVRSSAATPSCGNGRAPSSGHFMAAAEAGLAPVVVDGSSFDGEVGVAFGGVSAPAPSARASARRAPWVRRRAGSGPLPKPQPVSLSDSEEEELVYIVRGAELEQPREAAI